MATLSDIAHKAGCSVNLVSYVLKKTEPVTKEKHKEILRIANELNYRTNHAARALVTGKTDNITVVVECFQSQMRTAFFAEFLSSLAETLRKEKLGLQLKEIQHSDAEDMKNILLSGNTDGFLWFNCPVPKEMEEIILQEKIPSISLFEKSKAMPSILIDDYKSSYNMLEYLYDCGHRDFACCCSAQKNPRVRAYDDFLRNKGLVSRAKFFFREGFYNNIYEVKSVLEQGGINFTAVFCECDSYAIELISFLRFFKIEVPQKVSVAGYDDIPAAQDCCPPLTTLHQSYREMAQNAMDKLLSLIGGTDPSKFPDQTIVHEIVIR